MHAHVSTAKHISIFCGENLFFADLIFSIKLLAFLRLRELLSPKSIFDRNNKKKNHIYFAR